jgi:segregation and condensation protein B
MTDNEVTSAAPADIDSYLEPLPEPAESPQEPERRDIDVVAGEQAIGGDLLQQIIEGALLSAGKPLSVADLAALFDDHERPAGAAIREALAAIGERHAGRGFELREVASGFRFQVVQGVATWIARLWEEKPQRYSRALLETLALIAYRQPITRGDIEDIRGVAVASNIMKTLVEREWVRIVGHKDVPGRPAMYATTRKFLDYFNLKNLDDLPPLAEIRDLDSLNAELALEGADTPPLEPSSATETVSADDAAPTDDAMPSPLSESPQETAGDGDELPA